MDDLVATVWRMSVAAGLAFTSTPRPLISVAITLPIWRDHHDLDVWQVDYSRRARWPSPFVGLLRS